MFPLTLIAHQLKPELFVPQLDATICVQDIFDPELPHNDTNPEVFGSNNYLISRRVS